MAPTAQDVTQSLAFLDTYRPASATVHIKGGNVFDRGAWKRTPATIGEDGSDVPGVPREWLQLDQVNAPTITATITLDLVDFVRLALPRLVEAVHGLPRVGSLAGEVPTTPPGTPGGDEGSAPAPAGLQESLRDTTSRRGLESDLERTGQAFEDLDRMFAALALEVVMTALQAAGLPEGILRVWSAPEPTSTIRILPNAWADEATRNGAFEALALGVPEVAADEAVDLAATVVKTGLAPVEDASPSGAETVEVGAKEPVSERTDRPARQRRNGPKSE